MSNDHTIVDTTKVVRETIFATLRVLGIEVLDAFLGGSRRFGWHVPMVPKDMVDLDLFILTDYPQAVGKLAKSGLYFRVIDESDYPLSGKHIRTDVYGTQVDLILFSPQQEVAFEVLAEEHRYVETLLLDDRKLLDLIINLRIRYPEIKGSDIYRSLLVL